MDFATIRATGLSRRRFLAALTVALPLSAGAHHRLSREQCQRLGERIRKLQSRLRQGYSTRQGRRYRERMRELELEKYRKC